MIDAEQLAILLDGTARVLCRRILLLLAMLMTFVLACWAMFSPSWIHLADAGGFGLLMWIYTSITPWNA